MYRYLDSKLDSFKLNVAEKQYIIKIIEESLIFNDSVIVCINRKDLGESSRGGV